MARQFEDKIERLKDQQEHFDKVLSKRHPSDVHCPDCDSFLVRLKTLNTNRRKSLKVKCSNNECNANNMKIIYETRGMGGKARVFSIEF